MIRVGAMFAALLLAWAAGYWMGGREKRDWDAYTDRLLNANRAGDEHEQKERDRRL